MKRTFFFPVILTICASITLHGADWPIYKGNIYFTGNNDEITVKNNNLKWLFQAEEAVFNPIISDEKIYFIDLKKNVYCVNEENGKLIWKINLREVSEQFSLNAKAMGKVKYPLVKDNWLFLSDSIVLYCIDKKNGKVVWARTGMREEKTWEDLIRGKRDDREKPGMEKPTRAIVDSIYSDPVIVDDRIFYGTRNVFLARDIRNGHMTWNNDRIMTYSGFPSYYDEYLFTQSMDYQKNEYSLYCIKADTGEVKWTKKMQKPFAIFSPVVYNRKVFMASSKTLYCIDLKTGELVWDKPYSDFITSNPSFTERAIVFTVGNRSVLSIDPETGKTIHSVDLGEQASPYFVIIRDQMYTSSTIQKTVGGKQLNFAALRAMGIDESGRLWEFIPPFPGGGGQPAASKGIMFLPAGNYLYAVGTDYYPRIVDGGSGNYNPYDKITKGGSDPSSQPKDIAAAENDLALRKEPVKPEQETPQQKMKMRKMKLTVQGKGKDLIPAIVEIKKWDKGKEVYSAKIKVSKPDQEIEVPDMDDVEVTASAPDYVPKKEIVSRGDESKTIELDRIEKGSSIVVDNIYFEINKAYLRKESLNILDRMIESMKRNKGIKLEVQGHTDATGPREHNLKLSERRADAVVEYMVKNGISPERLRGKGYGPDKPISPNTDEESRRKNRRTEFLIFDN